MDCHFLLQGIFPTQGLNPGSPTLQADALPSEPPGKPCNEECPVNSLLGLTGFIHQHRSCKRFNQIIVCDSIILYMVYKIFVQMLVLQKKKAFTEHLLKTH